MMRLIRKFTIAILVTMPVVSLVVAADTNDRAERLTAEAKQTITDIDRGEFDKVESRFDKKMSDALPIEKLTSTWASISQQAGKLKHVGDATTSEHGGFFVVLIPCEFENAPLNAQISYDADGKIAGMYFKPVASSTGGLN
jgi:ABC-type transport system involved in cytochrome bd biosynthesis fused ATPase/permease subunit